MQNNSIVDMSFKLNLKNIKTWYLKSTVTEEILNDYAVLITEAEWVININYDEQLQRNNCKMI